MKPQNGFTLVEVLIVTLLLVGMAITTFTSVKTAIDSKKDIDFKTEILQEGRAVLAIMSRDISLAYYFIAEDFIWETPAPPTPTPTDYKTPAPTAPKKQPVTFFQGKSNEIFFSSKSHQRTFADIPENEMHFVTYQLDGKKLIRGESFRAVSPKDREDPSRFRLFTVLDNINIFKLEYWDDNASRWTDSWDTERSEYRDRIPAAVRIEIEYTPDYPEELTRRKIEPVKIVSAVRINENALKPPRTRPRTNSSTNGTGAEPLE